MASSDDDVEEITQKTKKVILPEKEEEESEGGGKPASDLPLTVIYCGGILIPFSNEKKKENCCTTLWSLTLLFSFFFLVCGMPPEYCEFGATFDRCRVWIQEHCPEVLESLPQQPTETVETKSSKRGGKLGKQRKKKKKTNEAKKRKEKLNFNFSSYNCQLAKQSQENPSRMPMCKFFLEEKSKRRKSLWCTFLALKETKENG
jgi:hypothetical protein